MPSSLLSAAAALRSQLASFEPGELSGADCARLADELAATEKACGAARVLAAARAISCRAHEARGFSDGTAWVARQAGVSTGQARQALEAATGLRDCPGTKAALLSGEISWVQAAEVTRAVSEAPGAEEALLATARQAGLAELRDKARERVASATPVEELHRRQHQARYFRHWRDRLGMVCFAGALPPETGVALVNRVDAAAQRLRRAAAAGPPAERENFEPHAADALVALTSGDGQGRGGRADVVLVCDINAYLRGHRHAGEVCHIIDGGPVPVQVVQELAKDAFIKAVLHDGVQVHTVKHLGRHLPAELRTALDLGGPPGFRGAACADCGRRYGLEYDHVDPVAHGGLTAMANLVARCWPDHRAKTERDRQAGLLGPSPPPPRPARPTARGKTITTGPPPSRSLSGNSGPGTEPVLPGLTADD